MTLVPGAEGQTLSLVCDTCGQAVKDIESTLDQWAVVWAVISRTGWTGSPLAIGPHHCAQCSSPTAQPNSPASNSTPATRPDHSASIIEHPYACVVRLQGQLDILFAGELRNTLTEAVNRHRNVVLDLTAVRLLDSTALGQLVRARELTRRRGGEMCLVAASETIRTVLRTMRVSDLFRCFPDTADAFYWLAAVRPRQPSHSQPQTPHDNDNGSRL